MAGGTKKNRILGSALRPMLATLIERPFDDPAWVFEIKWDGFRVIAKVGQGKAVLLSRGGKCVTRDYPGIVAPLEKIRRRAVLDGELVALDEYGRSRFQLLQNAQRARTHLRYYVFDLLFLYGKDLRRLPLIERKRRLRPILPKSSLIRYSKHIKGKGVKFFRTAQRRRLEGIMAKRAQSHYYSGKRSREWLKIKTARRQEVVIVGFTKPRKSRKYFGALVLALRKGNSWRYAGHTGTGFSAVSLKTIHAKLKSLVRARRPFRHQIPNEKLTTWVRPKLVGEVKFTEWTRDGQMRHPAFVGFRGDKPAAAVVREKETRRKTKKHH